MRASGSGARPDTFTSGVVEAPAGNLSGHVHHAN